MMMVVVTLCLMVHIYTIGYMEEDDGYKPFLLSHISLFTFSMLMLVMSNKHAAVVLRLGSSRPGGSYL